METNTCVELDDEEHEGKSNEMLGENQPQYIKVPCVEFDMVSDSRRSHSTRIVHESSDFRYWKGGFLIEN